MGVTDAIQALIRSRESVDAARLRDTGVALEDLAARPVLRDPARSHLKGSPTALLSPSVTEIAVVQRSAGSGGGN